MPWKTKLRSVRARVIIAMSCLVIYVLVSYVLINKYFFDKRKPDVSTSKVDLEYVVVHLDFKGAPPKLSYLHTLLPRLKSHGVNGLLIEYEDMFPYEGDLKYLRAIKVYEKEELKAFLGAAASAGFEIIPLIQTLGHMEFVLKHEYFSFMREVVEFPDSMCPSLSESLEFLSEMLKQVIRFHEKIAPVRYIHLGCDEVFHINMCDRCRQKNTTSAVLLTEHIKFLTETIHLSNPYTTILVWDDMYRSVKPMDTRYLVFPQTDVVYWDYTDKRTRETHMHLYKYSRMFDNLWIATAFKGADGRKKILPELEMRFFNHLPWLNFMFDNGTQKKLYKFKGIILTGWSRYDHMATLCEILPASIPSLIINLILIEKYRSGVIFEQMNSLQDYIDEHIENSLDASLQCTNRTTRFMDGFDSESCHYAESDLYTLLKKLSYKTSIAYSIIDDYAYKFFVLKKKSVNDSEPKIEYEYVDTGRTKIETCAKIYKELTGIENELIELLSAYFENDVILEFVRTKIRVLKRNIEGFMEFVKTNRNTITTVSTSNQASNKSLT